MTDDIWMRLALEQAALAYDADEVPVGALIVHGAAVLTADRNRMCELRDPTAHAEMLVMKQAYALVGSLKDCTMYVTLEPCAMCAGAILQMHLGSLVFGAYDELAGCCGSVVDLTDHWFMHSTHTIGGVLEKQSQELLHRFFSEKRCISEKNQLY